MATEVKVPQMGESITSGILAAWLVKDGEQVSVDQPLFSLETDKVTAEGNAAANGVIRIKVPAGEEVAIGQVIALIEEGAAAPAETPAAPEAKAEAMPAKAAEAAPQPGPAARKLAAEKGVDAAAIPGSGKDGRATKGDIQAAAAKKPEETANAIPTPVNGQITDAVTQKAAPSAPAPSAPSAPAPAP
ncbi:MAG: biotin/lipoyl-containing protein, partial [Opitutales bacterium]